MSNSVIKESIPTSTSYSAVSTAKSVLTFYIDPCDAAYTASATASASASVSGEGTFDLDVIISTEATLLANELAILFAEQNVADYVYDNISKNITIIQFQNTTDSIATPN